jgi:hypothetical protein
LSRVELPEPVQATLEAVGERMERALR